MCFEVKASDEGFSLISGHTTTKPVCYICGKVLSNVQNLYKHIRTIHQRQVSTCDHCGSVFRNAESARKHMLKMHRNDIGHCRGLTVMDPTQSGCGWNPPTCSTSSTTVSSPFLLEQPQQPSIKNEDLT